MSSIDFDMNLSTNTGNGDIVTLGLVDAIKQSIRNIVLLQFYDKPYKPEVGTIINGLLFENISIHILLLIEGTVKDAINKFEPRVSIRKTEVESDLDNNSISVRLEYEILKTGETVSDIIPIQRVR